MQLIVYTQQITSRLEYIFSTLLKAGGIQDFSITNERQFYERFEGAKINYSSLAISEQEVWIVPVSLLFEQEIKHQIIEVFKWKNNSAFYESIGKDLPFDVFAASFYLLSRYEEYLPHSLDEYGRYAYKNSAAFKHNFLQIPLVNIWLKQLSTILRERFSALNLQPLAFNFLPTYDIDIAWSYLNKGWWRNAGGFLRSVLKGQFLMMAERIQVLHNSRKDPFDTYDGLKELHRNRSMHPLYFFLLSRRNKGYDKNILPNNKNYCELIRKHSDSYDIGIHPSWQSGDNLELLKEEIEVLKKICGKNIYKSRQHYIRMSLPKTYRALINMGITEDYSMGYGSINGFRASYCLPYSWYDLQNERSTSLTIYPFCYMDANSYYEQHFSADEAMAEMEHYYRVTKDVNGWLITVWHNHFLGTDKMFVGWKDVYENFLRKYFTQDSSS